MNPQILVVGGGMITHDQLLPSLYHMQRQRRIGEIGVCAVRGKVQARLSGENSLDWGSKLPLGVPSNEARQLDVNIETTISE